MSRIYPRKIKWQENLRYHGRQRSIGLAFAPISAKCEQVAAFTTCRDYLHDMIFCQVNKTDSCWYEMYKPGNMPLISLTQLRLAVVNTDDTNFPERTERALRFIHKIEKAIGINTPSRVYEVKNQPPAFGGHKVFMYVGDGDWMLAPPMLSLFSLGIRIGFDAVEDAPFEKTFEDVASGLRPSYTGYDTDITKTAFHGVKRFMSEGYRNIFYTDPRANYPTSAEGSFTHSAFGIAGFSAGIAKPYIKFWYPKNWVPPTGPNAYL